MAGLAGVWGGHIARFKGGVGPQELGRKWKGKKRGIEGRRESRAKYIVATHSNFGGHDPCRL